jgi:hypothetical protein
LICALGAVFYVMQKVQLKAVAVQRLRTQVLTTQMTEQDRLLLDQALSETEAERERLNKAFPDEEEFLDFIAIVDEISASEVEVVRFSVDSDIPTKIGRNPSFLPMTLILRGPEARVEESLRMITGSPYFVRPLALSKEFQLEGDTVTLVTQFHLYVADEFVKVNP